MSDSSEKRTKALEIESGAADNEPTDYAIRSAIEYGVLKMVEKKKDVPSDDGKITNYYGVGLSLWNKFR